MNKGYVNFISFARGIQNGFKPDDFPLLDDSDAEKEYEKVLSRFSFSFDVEKDILAQYKNREIDRWDAVEQLEDECNLSYNEACNKVFALLGFFSGRASPSVANFDTNALAYWIAPDGKILPVYKLHIDTVWDCPPAFGYTEDELKHIYAEYGEQPRTEGNARNYIVDNVVLKCGWVRIRLHSVNNTYHVEIGDVQGKYKDFLLDWAVFLVENDYRKAYYGVLICRCGESKPLYSGSLQDLIDFKLFNSLGMGSRRLLPITNAYDFLSIFSPVEDGRSLIPNAGRRKRSKYHGALVNNTFDDAPGSLSASSGIKTHPSIRYLVVNHMMHHSRRHLVKASLSGTLDTFLLQNYCAGLGSDDPGADIDHTGDNGRVALSFTTDSGHSTQVDLGSSLGTGYMVAQIEDGLGLFPDGTVAGELIDNAVIQEIVRSQGEREKSDAADTHNNGSQDSLTLDESAFLDAIYAVVEDARAYYWLYFEYGGCFFIVHLSSCDLPNNTRDAAAELDIKQNLEKAEILINDMSYRVECFANNILIFARILKSKKSLSAELIKKFEASG